MVPYSFLYHMTLLTYVIPG